jgi:hypothetical protein
VTIVDEIFAIPASSVRSVIKHATSPQVAQAAAYPSFSAREPSKSHPHLHRIDPWIRRGQARIRDMHVAQFQCEIAPRAEQVHTKRSLIHEVHRVGAGRNIAIREQRPSREFQVRRNVAMALEIPFQSQRIKARAIRRIRRLKNQKNGNSIDRIFKAPTQKSGKVRAADDPAIAQAHIECVGVFRAAGNRMPTTHPDLHFVPALLRRSLGEAAQRCN